ncbi:thiamine diphosphokinase [Cereibacter sphaeroides]|nr:thiamine diphosphokinase [Cereibacter sphaeroides]
MNTRFAKHDGITLVGGGAPSLASLQRALSVAPHLVAADGGADAALALGHRPDLAVGDFDSISDAARALLGPERLHHDPDQMTTDFDKVLAAVDAPLILGVGFSGARLDHTLAAMSTLAQNPHRRIVLDTGEDLCLLCPPRLSLDLAPGSRVSLYPLARVRCGSSGLQWPTDALVLDPLGQIGTSNAATGPVTLTPEGPSLLLLLPIDALEALRDGLAAAPSWPAPVPAR